MPKILLFGFFVISTAVIDIVLGASVSEGKVEVLCEHYAQELCIFTRLLLSIKASCSGYTKKVPKESDPTNRKLCFALLMSVWFILPFHDT